nr:hypothetical protein [Sphaerochaetaceae bacterium]
MVFNRKFMTKRGENVKSEALALIADKLYQAGINYECEPIIKLSGRGKILNPEFVVMNKVTGEKFLWLHFDNMGSKIYSSTVFMPRFIKYNKLGFIMGVNMIVTCEKKEEPIEEEEIDDTI